MQTKEPYGASWNNFVKSTSVRKQLKVGKTQFGSRMVPFMLTEDIPKSSMQELAFVLNSDLPVLLYSGQLDLIVPAISTEKVIQNCKWKDSEEFELSEKSIWRIDLDSDEVTGYVKRKRNFQFVVVRNGGHILPYDQPRVAFELISRFVKKQHL